MIASLPSDFFFLGSVNQNDAYFHVIIICYCVTIFDLNLFKRKISLYKKINKIKRKYKIYCMYYIDLI